MKIFNNFKDKKNDNIVIDENLGKQIKNAKRFGIFIVCALIIAFGEQLEITLKREGK